MLLHNELCGPVTWFPSTCTEGSPGSVHSNYLLKCDSSCHVFFPGSEQQVPVGLLDIEASIIPPLDNPILHESLAEHSFSQEAQRGEKQRLFISYTREWWREYTEASKKHGTRMVRIFSIDEYGKNR